MSANTFPSSKNMEATMEVEGEMTTSARYRALLEQATVPEATRRPARCRAIIFDQTGEHILGIGRSKPGKDPYVVYPGGGLEDSDATPVDGIWRELDEELSLTPTDVYLSESVIEFDDQYFYVGYALRELDSLEIGGPESQRSVDESGIYAPGWYPVGELAAQRTFPEEVSTLVDAVSTSV